MKLWWNVAMPALVAGVMAAGAPSLASAQGTIKMDGSSTVFPIAEALAEEYQISKRGKVRVTVGIAGTGGGFKKFCRGETDMSNASRPILKEEMEACRVAGIKYLEIPVAFDALTVVVNPQNTWVKTMTVADLKKMWEPARAGPHHDLEAGARRISGGAADAVRPRRRLRHVRLLHRGGQRQGQGEPRRLHGERGRQHAGAGRREQQERARILRFRVLRRAQGQDARRADRRRQGSRALRASRRSPRAPTTRCRGRCSCTSRKRRSSARRSRSSSSSC